MRSCALPLRKSRGLRDLPRFEANFDVTRRGGGLHVVGSISATVGQNCVVTLEPLANEVEETIDLVFEPPQRLAESAENEGQQRGVKWDDPEPLVGGVVDLGALATEFLILGLDPYPRKPGAVFEPPQDAKHDQGPFAALGRLAKRQTAQTMADSRFSDGCCVRASNRYSRSWAPFGADVESLQRCSQCQRVGAREL